MLSLPPLSAFLLTNGLTVTSYGCSPGEYASTSNIACRSCPAGKLADTDGKGCTTCPRRTYQPEEGSISCLDCPDNKANKSFDRRKFVLTDTYYMSILVLLYP